MKEVCAEENQIINGKVESGYGADIVKSNSKCIVDQIIDEALSETVLLAQSRDVDSKIQLPVKIEEPVPNVKQCKALSKEEMETINLVNSRIDKMISMMSQKF